MQNANLWELVFRADDVWDQLFPGNRLVDVPAVALSSLLAAIPDDIASASQSDSAIHLLKAIARRMPYQPSSGVVSSTNDLLRALIARHVNPWACDKNGTDALDIAIDNKWSDIISTLMAVPGAPIITNGQAHQQGRQRFMLHAAVRADNHEAVSTFLGLGMTPNNVDADGLSPLVYASTQPVLDLLLAAGASPDQLAPDGASMCAHFVKRATPAMQVMARTLADISKTMSPATVSDIILANTLCDKNLATQSVITLRRSLAAAKATIMDTLHDKLALTCLASAQVNFLVTAKASYYIRPSALTCAIGMFSSVLRSVPDSLFDAPSNAAQSSAGAMCALVSAMLDETLHAMSQSKVNLAKFAVITHKTRLTHEAPTNLCGAALDRVLDLLDYELSDSKSVSKLLDHPGLCAHNLITVITRNLPELTQVLLAPSVSGRARFWRLVDLAASAVYDTSHPSSLRLRIPLSKRDFDILGHALQPPDEASTLSLVALAIFASNSSRETTLWQDMARTQLRRFPKFQEHLSPDGHVLLDKLRNSAANTPAIASALSAMDLTNRSVILAKSVQPNRIRA